jgi:hypothetical protein
MADAAAIRGGRHSEQEVPILSTIRLASEATHSANKFCPHGYEVPEVVEPTQKVIVKSRLEGRTTAHTNLIDFVLIGVNQIRLRMGIKTTRDLQQRRRMELIVVIE